MSREISTLTPELEEEVNEYLGPKDRHPAIPNLIRAALAAHEHAIHFPDCDREVFLAFVGEAWNAGQRQRQVSAGEIEGSIVNELGIVQNFAATLALGGVRRGLLKK